MPAIIAYQNERHQIRRMSSEYLSRHRINHLLGVAMIGSDYHRTASRANRFDHLTEAFVYHLNSLDRGIELTCVADHVCIRIVHDKDIELAALDLTDDFFGDSMRAHLRLQIISGDFRRRNQDSLFARKLYPFSAV